MLNKHTQIIHNHILVRNFELFNIKKIDWKKVTKRQSTKTQKVAGSGKKSCAKFHLRHQRVITRFKQNKNPIKLNNQQTKSSSTQRKSYMVYLLYMLLSGG